MLLAGCAPTDQPRPTEQEQRQPASYEFDILKLGETGISLEIQKGVKLAGTYLNPDRVRSEIISFHNYLENNTFHPLLIGKGEKFVIAGYNVSLADVPEHRFVITEDNQTSRAVSGIDTESDAFTVTPPDLPLRVSFVSPVENDSNRFDLPIDANLYNLVVEVCNNFIDVKPEAEAVKELNKLDPNADNSEALWRIIGNEVICNSYALAVASKRAGVSYDDYTEVASSAQLQNYTSRGFIALYNVVEESVWNSL
jgi:hypothetical protein